MITDDFNHARYRQGLGTGHYESFFQRANHPKKPQAFWIRYTVFSPAGRPGEAVGELWAIVFDRDRDLRLAAKSEVPVRDCLFANDRFEVRIGDATLKEGALVGRACSGPREIVWDLRAAGRRSLICPSIAMPRDSPKPRPSSARRWRCSTA
jgi:hypothetical protein